MLLLPAIFRNIDKAYFWQITCKKIQKNIPLFWLGIKCNRAKKLCARNQLLSIPECVSRRGRSSWVQKFETTTTSHAIFSAPRTVNVTLSAPLNIKLTCSFTILEDTLQTSINFAFINCANKTLLDNIWKSTCKLNEAKTLCFVIPFNFILVHLMLYRAH